MQPINDFLAGGAVLLALSLLAALVNWLLADDDNPDEENQAVLYEVVSVAGHVIGTNKGLVELSPWTESPQSAPGVDEDTIRQMRALFVAAPRLLDAARKLAFSLVTIREEQVSGRMGFGDTEAQKKERATIYAAAIAREAGKLDEEIDAVLSVIGELDPPPKAPGARPPQGTAHY